MKNQNNPSSEAEARAERAGGIPQISFRIERLGADYRFMFAFHAREVRFERNTGGGFERAFPETFSFHPDRHDPTELYLHLDDLWSDPRRLHPAANRRDAEDLLLRLFGGLPGMLSAVLDRLEHSAALLRAAEDIAVLCLVIQRFIADRGLAANPRLRRAGFQLRALTLRALEVVVKRRVSREFMERYAAGEVQAEPSADETDFSFFYVLASAQDEARERKLVGAAERAYHRWLEEVCLDTENRAFESEDGAFAERELEVLRAVAPGRTRANRAEELSPFLCRPGSRACLRLLGKLETYFLRRYDVHHAAVMRAHADGLRKGGALFGRRLSLHGTRNYALALLVPALPFLLAVFFYERAAPLFDAIAVLEVGLGLCGALWLLGYRFMWRKDLLFFHTSVPRIGAGIIVGYLPVFLIDEVWDLAEQPPIHLLTVVAMLGITTFLYLYVEVQSRLDNPPEAFARARSIFLLGLVQAAGFGLLVTSLLGPLMAERNWGPAPGAGLVALPPFLGEMPRMVGMEPVFVFPSAVLLMSFLSFFIGTFLQLLWEDLPITEPL